MAVYDDQKSDEDVDKDFHDLIGHNFKPGEADQVEAKVQDEHNQGVDKELEDMTAAEQAKSEGGEEKAADKGELAEQESAGAGGVGTGSGDGGSEGGNGEGGEDKEDNNSNDSSPKKKGIRGWSRRKKWGVGIAAGLVGGGGTLGIIGLMVLSPLARVEMLLNKADSFYGAANSTAVDNAIENEIDTYYMKKVLPGLTRGNCQSTADIHCTATASNSTNPIGKMFNAWKEQRLENKMATQYGLVFGRQGSTLYINTNGKQINLKNGATSIFESADTKTATRAEIRSAVKDSFKEASFYDRYYTRWKIGKLLEQKYGIKRCIIACNIKDKFTDKVTDKKNAFKAYFIRRVVTPYSSNLAIALQCVISGGCDFSPNRDQDVTDENQTERRSPFQASIQQELDRFASQLEGDTLRELSRQVDTIGKEGIGKYAFRMVLSKILGKEITSEALDKFMTPIGWINLAASVINFIDNVGPEVKKMTFALTTAAAVQSYMFYETADHEVRAGHTDLTEFGTISDSLTTSSVDDNGKSSDMTQSPVYQEVVNNNYNTSLASSGSPSLFDTTAYAAETKHVATCNDGNPIPSGQRTCPEMVANGGNQYLSALSEGAKSIPFWPFLSGAASVWKNTVGKISSLLSDIISKALSGLPGYQQAMDGIAQLVTPLMQWLAKMVFPNPLAVLNGARGADLVLMGADMTYNTSANEQLGGARVTDQQAAAIRTAYLDDQKKEFQSKSLYARIFDTSSQYSLVTQMAAAMPTRSTIIASISSVLHDPFGHFSSAVMGAFSPTNHAFAAIPAQPDPYGIPQIAILPDQIPSDVDEAWWDKNCPDDYQERFLDSQTEDQDTGMMIASKPDPCMLFKTASQVGGGPYDSSLLPRDTALSNGSTTATPGTGGTTIPKGTAQQLAQQISTSPNISFQTKQDSDYFNSVIANGTQPGECSTVSISPILLGVILALSQKYKIVLGVFAEGHNAEPGCDTDHHADGSAVDINGVNPIDPNSGLVGTGNQLHFDPASMPIIRQFYADAGATLAANGGGGLGQYGAYQGQVCFGIPLPPQVAGVTYFPDACTHLHLDTRGHH